MSTPPASDRGAAGRDRASLLYAAAGLGDIAVGALVIAYPPMLGWLIGQPLDAAATVVARLLGCAALALGLGWWSGRRLPAARQALHAGFLVYNFGAGVVFMFAALMASEPVVPAIVSLLHLGLVVAGVLLPARSPSR